jgi:hypothetical protein
MVNISYIWQRYRKASRTDQGAGGGILEDGAEM